MSTPKGHLDFYKIPNDEICASVYVHWDPTRLILNLSPKQEKKRKA